MKPIHLYRIGSDPEFVFAKVVEWQHYVVPADSLITKNKAAALQSFIGVDGHAATAEFRPPPAHNVHRHMLDVAAAVQAVDEFLKKRTDTCAIALPWVGVEPLGGHIHLSFFIDEPLHKYAWENNYVSSWGKLNAVDPHAVHSVSSDSRKIEEYHKLCTEWVIPSPEHVARALNYLILPFESWIQPWSARRKRNSKYGEAPSTQVRWMPSKRPAVMYPDSGYMHVEYRSPSTWLVHPWVAYAYLSLAKLVMLNLPAVHEAALNGVLKGKDSTLERAIIWSSEPKNDQAREMFNERFGKLQEKLKFTNDIRDLAKAVAYCEKNRRMWFDPFKGVDANAWRELL